tara:strand:- start:2173 stop:2739 length:567 start_codon:yes stop_codon:yes gene_type:complete
MSDLNKKLSEALKNKQKAGGEKTPPEPVKPKMDKTKYKTQADYDKAVALWEQEHKAWTEKYGKGGGEEPAPKEPKKEDYKNPKDYTVAYDKWKKEMEAYNAKNKKEAPKKAAPVKAKPVIRSKPRDYSQGKDAFDTKKMSFSEKFMDKGPEKMGRGTVTRAKQHMDTETGDLKSLHAFSISELFGKKG